MHAPLHMQNMPRRQSLHSIGLLMKQVVVSACAGFAETLPGGLDMLHRAVEEYAEEHSLRLQTIKPGHHDWQRHVEALLEMIMGGADDDEAGGDESEADGDRLQQGCTLSRLHTWNLAVATPEHLAVGILCGVVVCKCLTASGW